MLVTPTRWVVERVTDPAAMGDLSQLALALGYGYLLAAVVATLGEAVAVGL
ncbi:hypothetical protein [Haloarchaeobius baliensis]|uniref:hypothetical protein n=1 Tax=Haloarchaeobius baliensis TaxID=1670458 RepID=UPI003F884E39